MKRFKLNCQARKRMALVLVLSLVMSLPLSGTVLGAPPRDTDEVEGGVQRIWALERVDAPQAYSNLTQRSLRLDSNNYPRVAYGGDHLYYARYDGNTWNITTVDGAFGVGQYASLALDRNANPHIAYYDALNGALKYARFTNNQWIVQTVDGSQAFALQAEPLAPEQDASAGVDSSLWDAGLTRPWLDPLLTADAGEGAGPFSADAAPGVGMYTSIATDSSNRAHISYYDAANGDLKYAVDTGSGWSVEAIAGTGRNQSKVGKYTSLTLDSDGDAHISYFNESFDRLEYIRQVDEDWVAPEIVEDSTGENVVGAYTSLALDGNGSPRISYYVYNLGSNEGDLKYATRSSGDWVTSFVDKTNDTGYYSSLALDSQGRPRISYFDATKADLRYAAWNGSTWDTATLAGSGNVGRDTSIAIDRNDNAHVSYLDLDNGLLNEIYMRNGNWSTRNITALRDVGRSSSLVLDKTDRPHISYFNDTTDDLKYATRAGAAWPVSIVADAGSVGTYTAVAVDAANLPHIAFYDATNGDLKYASYTGSSWQIETVDAAGDVGSYVSLVIDNQNYPSIAYYDATNKDLKYAWDPNPSDYSNAWQKWAMDSAGDVGKYTSIAVDSSRRFYISYFDDTNNQLKYAQFTSSWTLGVVPGWSGDLRDTSTAIDALGNPHITFYEVVNGDLKYAALSSGGWSVVTLDSTGNVGQYSSLELTSAGAVLVSYYDGTNGDLKLAELSGGTIKIELVDSAGQVGMYTSLALDTAGNPHISYYDASNGDLKYASGIPVVTQLFLPLILQNFSAP